MVRKYIKRDFTDHERTVKYIGDDDEYIKFECFSFDPLFTKIFLPETKNLTGENCYRTSWKSWSCYRSKDKINPMEFTIPFLASETGEYRIDILYEQNDAIFGDTNKDYNTGKDLSGWYDLYKSGSKSEHKAQVFTKTLPKNASKSVKKAYELAKKNAINMANNKKTSRADTAVNLLFDGENNIIKRKTIFKQLNTGSYRFEFAVPHNCYCMGVIVRKIKKYWGTNTDETGSNLQFTNAKLTISDMTKPSELEVTVGFDDDFECEDSPSGFYMDYMDEVNLYVKNHNEEIVNVFGGYLTSILPNNDRTQINIHCADRLKDGENKYILDQLLMQGGDTSETEYYKPKSFKTYGQALKYLCDVMEITLKSNISNNYLVDGEKYSAGKTITFGKKKDVKKVTVSNGQVTVNTNNIMVRNNAAGLKPQIWTLYNDNGKTPTNIRNYKNLHITYGLGDPKTEQKSKETIKVDVADSTAGSQKFTKCGVSADKKYIMAIGLPSAGKDSKKGWTRTIFERKCPHCGSTNLVWDIFYGEGGYAPCRGAREGGGNEGHIFCKSCDADYSVQGNEHISGSNYKLKKVSSTTASSKAEAQKLRAGNMSAVPNKNEVVASADVFKAIKNACKGYTYQLNTFSTATDLEKHKKGDCWAWSAKIGKELKKYKVNYKIAQYITSGSDRHRSVLYQNAKGEFVNFPYKDYGFPKQLYPTGKATAKGTHIAEKWLNGGRINQAVVSGSTTKTETKEVTVTKGYDKENPFQCYIKITYSLQSGVNAKKYNVFVNFTQKATGAYAMSGLEPVWVNNSVKKITLTDFIPKIQDYMGDKDIYLRTIQLVTPKINLKTDKDKSDWYTNDDTTKDNSSCKMILYQIAFNNQSGVQPSDLQACGKSVNDVFKNIVEDNDYIVDIDFGEHRVDDKINFHVNNNSTPLFTAKEGDNNNILEWGSITYSPVNSMFNMTMCVYKGDDQHYHYVDSRYAQSIMKYQEQCTLITENEQTGAKEAYWNARHNEKFNAEQTYDFSITVGGVPDLKLKDLVQVIANAKKLNTIKETESITITYSNREKPVIQTELGLGELAPDIQVRNNIRNLRANAKKQTTSFFGTAEPIVEESVYEWDN